MCNLRIFNYSFTCKQTLFAAVTLTGGVMVKRHWKASHQTLLPKWGHRIIALIEAVPVLGGLVALIEVIYMRCVYKPPAIPPFNKPFIYSLKESFALEILARNHESELPVFSDSYFDVSDWEEKIGKTTQTFMIITRRKKEERPPKMIAPLFPLQGNEAEGRKVRSLCLDFLNSLEQKGTPKKVLTAVEFFLRTCTHQKKASFRDYRALLEIVADKTKPIKQKIDKILKRQFQLVDLQELLPKKSASRKQGNPLVPFVKAGLLTKELLNNVDALKKIGLDPWPNLPARQTIVNLYPTLDSINYLNEELREAGRWLMTHTRVITFQELCQSIRKSCEQIREEILSWDSYSILVEPRKSQKWMADLACRFLPLEEKPPEQILSFTHSSSSSLIENFNKADNIIMFDDGAYSGQQISNYLYCLEREKTIPANPEKPKNLIIIVGFCPRRLNWNKTIEELAKHHINVKIITNLYTESREDIMEAEKLPLALREKINLLAHDHAERPLVVTEWKKPDFMSTPTYVTEGVILSYKKRLNYYSVWYLNGEQTPITAVVKPY